MSAAAGNLRQLARRHLGRGKYRVFRAPGRINLIGDHTDYNRGLVLPGAIQLNTWIALSPTGKHREAVFYSVTYEQEAKFGEDTSLEGLGGWRRYVAAVLELLRQRGFEIRPLRGLIDGNIPQGAGMASSASLCCALIYALDAMHEWGLDPIDIATYAQQSEHLVGTQCGLMDQLAILHGKQNKLLAIDCDTNNMKGIRFPHEKGWMFLIDSAVRHDLVGSEYNARRQSCETVFQRIKEDHPSAQSLRDIDQKLLFSYIEKVENDDFAKAQFVVEENKRVRDSAVALLAENLEVVGLRMKESHAGLRTKYLVSCPELDFLVDQILTLPNVYGARMMGGGFGGCTINLVRPDFDFDLLKGVKAAYQARFDLSIADIYRVELGDGAREVT